MSNCCTHKHAFWVNNLSLAVEMTLNRGAHVVIMTPECYVEFRLCYVINRKSPVDQRGCKCTTQFKNARVLSESCSVNFPGKKSGLMPPLFPAGQVLLR